MSDDGVDESDMEDMPDFEEDPVLADLLGDVRVAYGNQPPVVSPTLAERFEAGAKPHRSASMRRYLAQLVTATTVVVAATGGLAIAGALPAPVQDAVSGAAEDVGVDLPDGEDGTTGDEPAETTSTTPDDESAAIPTTVVDDENAEGPAGENDESTHPDNHGREVSEVARDKTLHGCEHGRAVSAVASGKVKDKPCPHAEDETTTPTTVAEDPAPEPEPAPTTADSGARSGKEDKPARGSGNGHAKARNGR